MADPIAKKLIQRFDTLSSMRASSFEPMWQEIADHVIGRRDFTVSRTPGERREIQMYDTTGRNMTNLLSGGLHSLLVNPATDWFDLRTGNPALMEDVEVKRWLEDCERVLYSIFHAPEARFTSQADEFFLDLVGFGTGGMFVGDPPGRQVLFSARPLNELFISENASGVIDTIFRSFKMTARQVASQWPDSMPEKVKNAMKAGKPEEEMKILHGVWPAEDGMRMGFRGSPMPFQSAFLHLDGKELLGRVGGYHEMPYLIGRWRVDGGEVYGRGPGGDSLADQKMTSAMKLTTLQAGQMAVAPPFLTEDDSSIVQLDLRPFGRNIVRGGGMLSPPIQPLDVRSRAEISVDMIRDTRRQVEESFHFEMLKLIQNPGLTPMTATQTRAIRASVERLLAPILGRLHSEFLGPLIDRVFGIAARRGLLPPAPPILQGHTIEVEYQNPITRAQRENESEAAIEFLALVSQFGQADPSLLDIVNPEEALRFVADQKGVPASILRSRRELAKLRQAQAEIEQEQQQQEALMRTAEVVQKLTPALRGAA